ALLLGDRQRLLRGHDAQLRAVVVDDADLFGPDAVVDADRPLIYETPPEADCSSATARSAARRAILAPSSATAIGPRSPLWRWRTETFCASTSLSPTTSMYGTFWTWASRIL